MKRLLRLSVLVLALIAVLLVLAGPVAAKATKTEFTATEIYLGDLSTGKEWYTGKDDKIYHQREAILVLRVEQATDVRVNGDEIVTLNVDMQLVDDPVVWATGRMWGTFKITNDDGTWEGTWTGLRDEQGFSYFEYVGKGGGAYAGLQLRVHDERLDPNPTALYHWTGYILDPHGE
jgi:hypothetical protein